MPAAIRLSLISKVESQGNLLLMSAKPAIQQCMHAHVTTSPGSSVLVH
jgi:hypothetical protein